MTGTDPSTIRAVIAAATSALAEAGVESARLDAEVLLAAAASCDRTRLYIDADRPLAPTTLAAFRALLERRLRREPIQYIVGTREFWSLDFLVTPDVLIPRPETEGVVEAAVELLREETRPLRLCDVGTGSGCIAVALARELPTAEIWAIDQSAPALRIARLNAERHAVADRIQFVCADLLAPVGATDFDAIVSNPPYAAGPTIAALEPELGFEPRAALDGGPEGLDVLRRLLPMARRVLRPSGWLIAEIGFDQADGVAALCRSSDWRDFSIRPDYQGIPRVLVAQASAAPATRRQLI